MKLFLFLLFALLQSACVSNAIIRDKAYGPSVAAYQRGDIKDADDKFPDGEKNGFITEVEKSWLRVWRQEWKPDRLQAQIKTFDERNYTSLSREAGYFLFQESEEGYVPSEHEVVILHLLSAIHYNQVGKLEDAKVELRRAGYVLDRFWDDAPLRLWLASLWAAVGEWDEAQVDLRRAYALSPSAELKKLAHSRAPKHLTLHFFGNGPKTRWIDGRYSPDFDDDSLPVSDVAIVISTLPWFRRHTQRNTELRDVLVKSNFMAQYLGAKTLTTAEHGISKAGTITLRILGVAVGAALLGAVIYVAAQTGGGGGDGLGYLAAGAIGVGYGIWKGAADLDEKLTRGIIEDDRRKQESLRIYRMARFMPTYVGLKTHEVVETDLKEFEIKVPIRRQLGRTQLDLINHF